MKIQISLVVATLLICCYSGSEVEATAPEGGAEKWFFDLRAGLLIRRELIAENENKGRVKVIARSLRRTW